MKLRHHKQLSLERWQKFSLAEQMANVGSEVFRALSWRHRDEYNSRLAFERSLELFDLTKAAHSHEAALKELCRAKEAWADYFYGTNEFKSTQSQWESYFMQFTYFARNQQS